MAPRSNGETLQERSKGKDVRTSNIVAAKVNSSFCIVQLIHERRKDIPMNDVTLSFYSQECVDGSPKSFCNFLYANFVKLTFCLHRLKSNQLFCTVTINDHSCKLAFCIAFFKMAAIF